LARNHSFARCLSPAWSRCYPGDSELFEIQIGNDTRPSAVLGEEGSFRFAHVVEQQEVFLFGAAPLIENFDTWWLKEWTCIVSVLDTEGGESRRYETVFPYNGRSDCFAYFPGDGWVDMRVDLREFVGRKCSVSVQFTSKGKDAHDKELNYGVACPQVLVRRDSARTKNVLLLSVESLTDPAYLQARYGFGELENLQCLSEAAVVYPQVYTPSDSTLAVAGSMHTGLLPTQHGIGDYGLAADSFKCEVSCRRFPVLAEMFKDAGYFTAFGGVQARFSPKTGWARGFDRYHHVFEKWATNVPEIDWLIRTCRALEGVDKFLYQHIDLLHEPLLSFGDRHNGQVFDAALLASAKDNQTQELYGAQLKQLDWKIGQLLEYLRRSDQYENTAVIITGDHGCGLSWVKGGMNALYEERIRVPLIVKYPDWCEERLSTKTIVNSTIEIHRIVRMLLNRPLSAEVRALPQYNPEFTDYAFSETIMNPGRERKRHSLAIMHGRYKYICWNEINWEAFKVQEYGKEELYVWNGENQSYIDGADVSREQEAITTQCRQEMRRILETNLEFLSRHSQEKY